MSPLVNPAVELVEVVRKRIAGAAAPGRAAGMQAYMKSTMLLPGTVDTAGSSNHTPLTSTGI